MKWLSTSALALLTATTAFASPIAQETQETPESYQDDLTVYILKIKTDASDELNGKSLGLLDSVVGVYDSSEPLEVYTITNDDGKTSLHTWPIGIVDHALSVVGDNGLFELKDVTPGLGGDDDSAGTNSWEEFTLDEKTSEISWRDEAESKWVVFPTGDGGFVVKWRTDEVITTQNYFPISIVYEEVEDVAQNGAN